MTLSVIVVIEWYFALGIADTSNRLCGDASPVNPAAVT
jgi:hypothetical protein